MEHIKEFFRNDKFAEYVGIELLEVSEGQAKARLKVDDRHLNGVGLTHGAAIFTLADLVFAVASNSHGRVAVSINASIAYLKAIRDGILFAEAREVSLNPKLATYIIHVTDQDGNMVATFQGTVYRKKERLQNEG